MKSKLIRLFAVVASVLVLVVALVVPMSADYSSETGWSEPDQVVDGALILDFVRVNPDMSVFSMSIDFYGYKIIPDLSSVDSSLLPSEGYVLPENFNWYYTAQRGDEIENFIAKGLWIDDNGDYHTNVSLTDGLWSDVEFDITLLTAVYFDSYPPEITEVGLQFFSAFQFDVIRYIDPAVTAPFTSVWTSVMTWITSGLNSVQGVFYANNQLTMLGTLAVIGVAIAVVFLLIGVLQRFLHLRG